MHINEFINTAELSSYLSRLFGKTALKISASDLKAFTDLIVLLKQWNQSLNLTAIKDPLEMAKLHILDSAVASPLLGDARMIADVGTGAGFPGLVLAKLNPDKEFTLIDSVGKKLSFVRAAAVKLGLENVKIIHARVEDLKAEPGFEVIISRAFAPLGRMVDWCLPLLSENGRFIALKAHLYEDETADIPPTVKIDRIESLQVPELEAERKAVVLSRV